MNHDQIHEVVKAGYAEIARQGNGCCGGGGGGCGCGIQATSSGSAGAAHATQAQSASRIGYTDEDIAGHAAEANLGLGCGNPAALASLKAGEVVVDLGSGAGFDALLSAQQLGSEGRFIGVDMTPEMLERARTNAVNAGFARTVEFREGLIEALPVATGSADVVISNCVINLSPDKAQVFREAFRVLKPGGRLAVSDILLTQPLPQDVAELAVSWIACVGGALTEEAYFGHIRAAGFVGLEYTRTSASMLLGADIQDPMLKEAVETIGKARVKELAESVFSYSITARKP